MCRPTAGSRSESLAAKPVAPKAHAAATGAQAGTGLVPSAPSGRRPTGSRASSPHGGDDLGLTGQRARPLKDGGVADVAGMPRDAPGGSPGQPAAGRWGVVQGTVLTGRTSISKGHVLSYGIFGGTCRRPRRTPEWPLGVRDGGRGAGTRGSPTRGGHWHSSLCTARQRPRPDARRSHVLAVTAGRLGEERGNAPNCF